jgi:hypothetical protein
MNLGALMMKIHDGDNDGRFKSRLDQIVTNPSDVFRANYFIVVTDPSLVP